MNESPGITLCKACGLCCSGHLFVWTKLRSAELDSIESLGLKVFREPNQRGFNQPCALWDGICTIYDSPQYPRFCKTFKCKLLKQVLEEVISLPSALEVVSQTKSLIHDVDLVLSSYSTSNFRERLAMSLEDNNTPTEILHKAKELLEVYESQFGVNDIMDMPDKS